MVTADHVRVADLFWRSILAIQKGPLKRLFKLERKPYLPVTTTYCKFHFYRWNLFSNLTNGHVIWPQNVWTSSWALLPVFNLKEWWFLSFMLLLSIWWKIQPEFSGLPRFFSSAKILDGDWSISEITVPNWLIFREEKAQQTRKLGLYTFGKLICFLK